MRAVAVIAVLLVAGILGLAPVGLAELDYLRANRHHRAGDLAKAQSACESALRRRPAHAGARALLKTLLSSRVRESCGNGAEDQTPYHMDWLNATGFRSLERGDPEAAETSFRSVLGLAALEPWRISLKAHEARAREGLERIAAMLEDR